MRKVFAFTLAEVLIALAIVGIVAAVVIPTLMVNMQARKYKVALDKGLSTLAKAATANFGLEGYDFSGTNGYYGEVNNPIATYSTGGTDDGYDVIGFNTTPRNDINPYSDLFPYTPSLFHIWRNNLNLKSSKEVVNYAVSPADSSLNCASRPTYSSVKVKNPGDPEAVTATIKPDFKSREYWSLDIIQGSGGIYPMCEGRSLADGGFNQGRMFMLEDGMVFTYDPAQAYCLETNPCYGYLDVNGPEPPNRVVACSEGVDSYITTYGKNALPGMLIGNCTVKSGDVTDIYPILFYNNVVKPASWAAKSVYQVVKSNQIDGTGEEIAEVSEE